MPIDPITQLQAGLIPTIERTARTTHTPDLESPATTPGAASFGDLFKEAVLRLDQLQKEADGAAVDLATGASVDIHDVMIAFQKADLGMQLAVQVRNKLVEAYQEIMRMPL